MKFISNIALKTSQELAQEKSVFPSWKKSKFYNQFKLRNCSLLAISPSGARSIFADVSPAIEPNFALGFVRKVMGDTEILQINKVLETVLKEYDIYNENTLRKIIQENSLENIELPEEVKHVFVTMKNIKPKWHIKIQATMQKYIDNAISKTVNFKKDASLEDIRKVFIMAFQAGCKGVTVYRDGSLQENIIKIN